MRVPFASLQASSFRVGLVSSGFQLALAHAVRSAFDQGHVSVMGKTVEQGGDGSGVGEDGVPFFKGFIGGQQNGITLVAVIDDFKEQVGSVGVVSQIATFVDDEQGGTGIEAKLAAAQAGRVAVEIGEQFGGGAEEDGVAGQHSSVGDVFGNHGFAQTVAADDDGVAGFPEKIQGEGAFD